ncbi:MAG: hypothetical protein BalsKO_01980 [Balneolaceae bacterium]
MFVTLKNGKKPELLLKRILDLTLLMKMISFLIFTSAVEPTAAVGLKMRRQVIGIEQLDYEKNDSLNRLNNVVKGDNSGISKYNDVNWKGGGSFTYLETQEFTIKLLLNRLRKQKYTKALLSILEQMKAKSFLNYNVDIKKTGRTH